MDVTLPDGTTIQGVPDGTTKAQLAEKLKGKGMNVPDDWMKPAAQARPQAPRNLSTDNPVTQAVGESALQMGSGLAASAVGGVRGLYDLASGQGAGKASADIESTQEALTYQPRSAAGKAASKAVGAPFRWLAGKGDQAGQAVADVSRPVIGDKASAALGAGVNTAVQSAPAALVPGARGLSRMVRGGEVGAAVAEGAPGPGVSRGTSAQAEPQGAPQVQGAPQAQPQGAPQTPPLSASGAPRGPVTDPSMAPPSPPQAPGAPQPPLAASGAPRGPMTEPPGAMPPRDAQTAPGAQTGTPEGRAEAYAGRIGLDWARLGAGTRRALTTIAQDAKALDRLDPRAVERQAVLEGRRIPIRATRGQLTLDPVQQRQEALAATTTAGRPIVESDIAANRDVQANLEALRGRVGGLRGGLHDPAAEGARDLGASLRAPTKTKTQVGESVQSAARGKAAWSKRRYDAAYKVARETEPDARAELAPVTSLLTENPEIQHLGWVQSWLNKAARAKGGPEGEPVALTDATLNELHDLRSTAGSIARTGGKEGFYAGQVVKAIDSAMEQVPEGAAAWKRANDLYREHQQEFANQAGVERLVANRGKMSRDPKIEHEKTWQKVATGSLEQLRQSKRTMLTGGTPQLRAQGRRAWREFRAETVNRILEDARNVSSTDPAEQRILTAIALRRSINRIPTENLEEILGKRNTDELRQILRAREITRGRTTQSGTVPNALVMAEKLLSHLPAVGNAAAGAARGLYKASKFGENNRITRDAQLSPLEQAARDVERSSVTRERRRREQYQAIEGQGPTLPPDSIGAAIPPGPQP